MPREIAVFRKRDNPRCHDTRLPFLSIFCACLRRSIHFSRLLCRGGQKTIRTKNVPSLSTAMIKPRADGASAVEGFARERRVFGRGRREKRRVSDSVASAPRRTARKHPTSGRRSIPSDFVDSARERLEKNCYDPVSFTRARDKIYII